MAPDDYLKKLKESLDKGEQNDDVVNIHFEILKGADLEQAQRKSKAKDTELYTNEILDFVNEGKPSSDKITKVAPTVSEQQVEEARRIMVEYEKSKAKKDIAETNLMHIELLQKENQMLHSKIQKNNELINYLTEEMNKG